MSTSLFGFGPGSWCRRVHFINQFFLVDIHVTIVRLSLICFDIDFSVKQRRKTSCKLEWMKCCSNVALGAWHSIFLITGWKYVLSTYFSPFTSIIQQPTNAWNGFDARTEHFFKAINSEMKNSREILSMTLLLWTLIYLNILLQLPKIVSVSLLFDK